MLTEEMLGATLAELAQTREDVLDNLGVPISYARMKCALYCGRPSPKRE